MSAVFRTVAYAAWLLACGLSIGLAFEFHDYHFSISLGVAVLSLILSAFGLMLARHCAQQKDRLAMTIGIVLWAAGAISFAITEMGYWASSYKDRHAEYVQTKSVKARQEGLKDMAWEALRTGEARATVAELQSRIKAEQQSEFWTSTKECTDATTAKSRGFCQSYFDLQAKVASAGKLESMETRFLNEKVDTKATMIHNVFAGADLIAENSDLTEKQAATLVVLIIALVLMLARDLLLIVANPFGGHSVARAATPQPRKDLERRTVVLSPSAAPEAPTPVSEPKEEKPVPFVSPEPVKAAPLPVKEATAVIPPLPKVGQSVTARNQLPEVDNVLAFPKAGKRGKGKKREGLVKQWLEDCTSQVDDPKIKATSKECRSSYVAWCSTRNAQPVGQKVMSRQIGVILGRSKGERGRSSRNAHGNVYPGLLVFHPAQEALRA